MLAEFFDDLPVTALYSSDLWRAQETALVIGTALGLSVQINCALRERSFGVWEGREQSSLCSRLSGIQGDRVVDISARPKGGESLSDLSSRVGTFIDWLADEHHDGEAVVVTHGGTVRAIRAYCAGHSLDQAAWDQVPSASVWHVALPQTDSINGSPMVQRENGGIK
jgi:broad specificity phosphatase PhoE